MTPRRQEPCGCVFISLRVPETGELHDWQVVWCPEHAERAGLIP